MSKQRKPLPAEKRTPITDLLYKKVGEGLWTYESFGKAVGHSLTVVSKIINGKMKIPIDKIETYAEALDTNPLELLKMVHPEVVEIVQRCLDKDVKYREEEA